MDTEKAKAVQLSIVDAYHELGHALTTMNLAVEMWDELDSAQQRRLWHLWRVAMRTAIASLTDGVKLSNR